MSSHPNAKKCKQESGPRLDRAFEAQKTVKLAEVKQQLEAAFTKAFTHGSYPRDYKQVNVVLLHFNNDDLKVSALEDEIAETFRDEYGYTVQQVVLSEKNTVGTLGPGFEVVDIISELEKKGGLDAKCLVIIVFSGHGKAERGVLKVG